MSLVGKFAHLPNLPRSNEAGPLLEKVASQVKPIMAKRGWKVGTLGEFIPQNPALLGININHGQRINIRLRPHGNTSTFYDYEQLVLVMLHELTHIVHGPHDASFYKLLAELEEEYYSLKSKGYSGEGFHSDGKKLSGARLNEYEGRRRGLAAAEKRLNTQRKLGRGGVLGGAPVAGKSLREVIAEAAERRIRDDKSCNVDTKEAEEESRIAQEQSIVTDATVPSGGESHVVDLAMGDSSEEDVKVSRPSYLTPAGESPAVPPYRTAPSRPATPTHPASIRKPPTAQRSAPSRSVPNGLRTAMPPTANAVTERLPSNITTWTCATCTLHNPMSATACEACTAPRTVPAVSAEGWYCDFCGAGPREMGFWSCESCGWVRRWG